MSKLLRSLHTLIIACLLLCLTLPVLAAGADTFAVPEVKVGMVAYPGYAYVDEHGNLTGADVEYAYRIAQYANLRFKIVLLASTGDMFKALDDGQIAMAFNAAKSPERQQQYLYARHEIGTTTMSVYVRADDNRFEFGSSDQLAGKTFGVEKDNLSGALFQEWCRDHSFTPVLREYTSIEALNTALQKGEIDAVVAGAASPAKDFRTVLLFAPQPYYIIFTKSNLQLKNTIDDAMARLLSENPLYADKLLTRYVGGRGAEMYALTQQEKAYLAAHPVLKIAVIQNDQPYFYETKDGTSPSGVVPDFYAKISSLTGLKFEYMQYKTHGEAVAAVKNKQADILGLFSDGQINAYNEGLSPTREYGTVNMVFVTEAGLNRGPMHKVAVKQRTRGTLASTLTADKQLELITYANGSACFNAMKNHEVDAMICGLPTASWIVNQNSVTAYSIAPVSALTVDLCGAVAYGNETLSSILNKAIKVSDAYFDGIVASNTAQEASWSTFIARIPPLFTALFAIVMLLLVAGLILALVSLNRRSREKAAILAAKAENEQEKIKLEAIAKSAEEKNQFFSNISHDMRTPLNAIIGFSSLASKENVSGVARDYLNKIQSSGELLLELINDTLNLSKLNSGKLKLRPEPVACAEIFNAVVIPIREAAESKRIEFTANKSELALPYILADRLNLQKVILNLLTNAVKYTPAGGHVSLQMGCNQGTDGQYTGFIIVKDDGIGISPDFLPHIYEPFAQEQSTGYEGTGTGLGLAIVKQLVDLMGGTIAVDTAKGKGTTFTIRLPIQPAETPAVPAAAPLPDSSLVKLAGKKILLCEDNALNREIAGAILRKQGMQVTYAVNGQKGVDIFTASAVGEYAAILMDLRMPVLDGFGATTAIRNLDRADAATIPIIAMTADVFAETVEKCLAAGMNAHLSKPVDTRKVYQVLGQLIDA
jgi:signal transduction histidine kinase/BarA-like signal transduction histidine kinase